MSNKFIPHTSDDIARMLERIGVKSIDDLYAEVPSEVIYKEKSATISVSWAQRTASLQSLPEEAHMTITHRQ